jgi:ATP-dependent DNA ligase
VQSPVEARAVSNSILAQPGLCSGAMSAPRELYRQLKRFALCLPALLRCPQAGPDWIHEIKHDGFRILAEREGKGVILHTRRGFNFADRFPLTEAAIAKLPVKSCLIDGEAIVCDSNGAGLSPCASYALR